MVPKRPSQKDVRVLVEIESVAVYRASPLFRNWCGRSLCAGAHVAQHHADLRQNRGMSPQTTDGCLDVFTVVGNEGMFSIRDSFGSSHPHSLAFLRTS